MHGFMDCLYAKSLFIVKFYLSEVISQEIEANGLTLPAVLNYSDTICHGLCFGRTGKTSTTMQSCA